jgi:hypothetical protein
MGGFWVVFGSIFSRDGRAYFDAGQVVFFGGYNTWGMPYHPLPSLGGLMFFVALFLTVLLFLDIVRLCYRFLMLEMVLPEKPPLTRRDALIAVLGFLISGGLYCAGIFAVWVLYFAGR